MDGFSILPEEQQSDQQLAVAGSTPSARPNQKRSKNFNEKEDKLLVSAWLNISTDPVLGEEDASGAAGFRGRAISPASGAGLEGRGPSAVDVLRIFFIFILFFIRFIKNICGYIFFPKMSPCRRFVWR